MKFQYRAINSEGAVMTGSIAADNLRLAARLLQRQGLTVVDLKGDEAKPQETRSVRLFQSKHPSAQELLMCMHQLCTLLESGVSLEESVGSLAESASHPFLARELSSISGSLRKGTSFSEALKECELVFPSFFHPLSQAGELTGKMAAALRDGVKQWEFDLQTSNELKNALTYPTILILTGITAILLIFAMVVPKFVNLLQKAHGDVPFLARMVLGTGSFVNEHMLLLGIAGLILGVGAGRLAMDATFRQKGRDWLATLPVLKTWLLETDVGRWSAMLSTLLENRVPLLNALELAQRNTNLSSLRANMSHVSQSVRNGVSLAVALQETGAMTPTGYNLVKVGERSGELPRMLRSLAILYTDSGRNRIKRLLLLLEPMAILLIGAAVGIIMAGIMQAITSVNSISL